MSGMVVSEGAHITDVLGSLPCRSKKTLRSSVGILSPVKHKDVDIHANKSNKTHKRGGGEDEKGRKAV